MNSMTMILLLAGVVIVVLIMLFNNGKLNIQSKKGTDEPNKTTNLINYNEYHMTAAEKIKYILIAALVLFSLGFLFYRSFILAAFLAIPSYKYPKIKQKDLIKKRKIKLQNEFKDALYTIYTSISAGSSPTNAIIESVDDLKRLYIDDKNFIVKEFEIMKSRLLMNESIENVLEDFSKRSGLEDVENFSEVFITSMDTGGKQADIIKSTINTIIEKIEIKREIEVLIAEKKFEARIMNVMPIIIIIFLSMAASDYLQPLFEGILGRIIVTIVIILLLIGNFLSRKLMDIEV